MSDQRIDDIVAEVQRIGGRIAAVEVELTQPGLSSGLLVRVFVTDAGSLTTDELRAVTQAVWDASWFQPVNLNVLAYQDGVEPWRSVDVRSAASELGLNWAPFFDGIVVSDFDLVPVLGEWQERQRG